MNVEKFLNKKNPLKNFFQQLVYNNFTTAIQYSGTLFHSSYLVEVKGGEIKLFEE